MLPHSQRLQELC
jgi:hypothetical protein